MAGWIVSTSLAFMIEVFVFFELEIGLIMLGWVVLVIFMAMVMSIVLRMMMILGLGVEDLNVIFLDHVCAVDVLD